MNLILIYFSKTILSYANYIFIDVNDRLRQIENNIYNVSVSAFSIIFIKLVLAYLC